MAKKLATKRKLTFAIKAPEASVVQLAGDFTQWQEQAIPLKRQKDGTWKSAIELEPGTYHYRFVVDGQWTNDPQCAQRVPNPFGGENSVCQVA